MSAEGGRDIGIYGLPKSPRGCVRGARRTLLVSGRTHAGRRVWCQQTENTRGRACARRGMSQPRLWEASTLCCRKMPPGVSQPRKRVQAPSLQRAIARRQPWPSSQGVDHCCGAGKPDCDTYLRRIPRRPGHTVDKLPACPAVV